MLQEELKKVKGQVDGFLKEFFDEKKKRIGKVHGEVAKMIGEIENICLTGGKRSRPFMVWLGSHGARQNKSENSKLIDKKLLKVMVSVELLHCFALIHDDVIDRAKTRHGMPTIRPGERAILAGDLCFTFADELLNSAPIAIKEQYDLLREEVIAGQLLDVVHSNMNKNNEEILNKIYEYKTARYSFLRPFLIGGKFAGLSHGKSLQQVLINLGILFQMRDDYLDLFGDGTLGKPLGGDLKEGKLTMLLVKFLKSGGLSSQKQYDKIFGNPNLTLKDVDRVKKIMTDVGVKRDTEDEMTKRSKEVIAQIKKLEINSYVKQNLLELAEWVGSRTK